MGLIKVKGKRNNLEYTVARIAKQSEKYWTTTVNNGKFKRFKTFIIIMKNIIIRDLPPEIQIILASFTEYSLWQCFQSISLW